MASGGRKRRRHVVLKTRIRRRRRRKREVSEERNGEHSDVGEDESEDDWLNVVSFASQNFLRLRFSNST